jgi:ribosomal protein S12 methylthiotransferase accessory factor
MLHTPKFKSHLRVELLPPDLLFVLTENGHQAFQGKFIYSLASLIDGKRTVSQIKERLKNRMTAFDVDAGLLLLEADGFIVDAQEALPLRIAAFCDSLNIDIAAARRRLKQNRVAVTATGSIQAASLISILTDFGIQVSQRGDFRVVLVDDYLQEELVEFNREAIRSGRKWMIGKPTGNIFWIGPVFRPPSTACWQCLALRLKENRRVEGFLQAQQITKLVRPPSSAVSPTSVAALSLIAIEILKQVLSGPSRSADLGLITWDVREMILQRHAVLQLDHCSACKPVSSAVNSIDHSARIVLKRRKKILNQDGGHRSSPAEATFAQYQHHISPITGIVDRIIPYESNGNGVIQSYVAGHIFVPRLEKEDIFQRGFVQQSGGKGMSAQQARTSALCEALERYSGVFRGNEPRQTAKVLELAGVAILPNACMNFSERQYEIREKWNRTHHNHDWVPVRFNEDCKIEWTPVWSLTHQAVKYLPTAYCYYGYPMETDHQFCRADSNGNAAGNSREEAILHGFLELVERDATAIWWFNKLRRPGVDLVSFGVPYIETLRKHYRKINRDFWVLDITADFPIASFVAISNLRKSAGRQFLVGFGAHLDPVVALTRALTEMNQFLPALESGNLNGVLQPAARDMDFLAPDSSAPLKRLEDFPQYKSNDFQRDISACVKMAKDRGLETLVIDQTRADVGLPVVKVIVPGMRQFWPRLGKGRLYDVPVQLGWLKKARTEIQLNHDRIVI